MNWSRAGDASISASKRAARAKRIEPPLPHTYDTETSKSFLKLMEAQEMAAFKRYKPAKKKLEPSPVCPPTKGKPKLDMGLRPSTAMAKMRGGDQSVRFETPSAEQQRPSTSMGRRSRPGTPGSVSPVWRVPSQTPKARCSAPNTPQHPTHIPVQPHSSLVLGTDRRGWVPEWQEITVCQPSRRIAQRIPNGGP